MNAFRIFLALVLLVASGGCAKVTPLPHINTDYYPQCYQPFVELHEAQVAMRNRTILTTAGGALAGAVTGAVTGFLTGKNLKATLIGTAIGAVGGGIAGFTVAKIREIDDEQQRLAAYRAGMETDLRNASAVELAALRSLKCYVQEFESLRRDFAGKLISKEDFTKRYAEIRTGIVEIGKITSESKTMLVKRDAEFKDALQADAATKKQNAKLTTVEKSRIRHEKQSKRDAAKYTRQNRKKVRQQRKEPGFDENALLQLANLQSELDRLESNAEKTHKKYPEPQQTPQPTAATHTAPAQPKQQPPVSVKEVASVYNNYPDQIASLEAVERQRLLTLEIMGDVASKSGIDMV